MSGLTIGKAKREKWVFKCWIFPSFFFPLAYDEPLADFC